VILTLRWRGSYECALIVAVNGSRKLISCPPRPVQFSVAVDIVAKFGVQEGIKMAVGSVGVRLPQGTHGPERPLEFTLAIHMHSVFTMSAA
jgi:hypothetical protein